VPADLRFDPERLADVCRRYGIARLDVFGSVARGDERPESDLDVLYTLEPGRHLTSNIELLADELAEVFGRSVDLVSRRGLHPAIRNRVEQEAAALYAA
jgi:predicted nucleotidyltransferase